VFAHAGFPEQLLSSSRHATSSAQAVSEAQHKAPRHCWQTPWAAISLQNDAGSGWQMPASSEGFQMQGRPPPHCAPPEHTGKQAPASTLDTATHAPALPHCAPVEQSAEQIPDAPSALEVKRRQTRL
jgi:hypothetical protein